MSDDYFIIVRVTPKTREEFIIVRELLHEAFYEYGISSGDIPFLPASNPRRFNTENEYEKVKNIYRTAMKRAVAIGRVKK